MNLKKRLLSIAAAGALATGALITFGSGAAQAASLGTLTITPASGTESTGLTATLSAGCPAGNTGIVGYVSGPGVPESNGVIQSNRPYASSFQMSGILKDVFAANSVAAPNGAYVVRIACIGSDFFTEQGDFSQTINVTPRAGTNNANYVTVVPAVNTTTALSQNNASGAFGSSVTFTANADVVGGGETAGQVQFKDNGSNLGSPQTVDASGVATLTTTTLAVGTHPITAVFTPTNAAGFNPSTSNGVSHVVTSVGTTLNLTSNSPSAQFAAANFTATVSPAVAGTVTFTIDALPPRAPIAVNGSGVATYSTSSLGTGPHTVNAHFTAGAGSGATDADATPITHNVAAFTGANLTENLDVTVASGSLILALEPGEDGNVHLGTATPTAAGDLLTASGSIDPVYVTDTRAGDPGWTVSGIVTNFSNGTDSFSKYNLGWTPGHGVISTNQVVTDGPAVVAGTEPNATTTPSNPAIGLGATRVLASAPDNSGNGTAHLTAGLSVNIPTDVSAGLYSAVLTLTAI